MQPENVLSKKPKGWYNERKKQKGEGFMPKTTQTGKKEPIAPGTGALPVQRCGSGGERV